LISLGRHEEAFAQCEAALEDPMVRSGSRRAIEKRIVRVAKKLSKNIKFHFQHLSKEIEHRTISAEKVPNKAYGKAIYINEEGVEMNVETLVLKFYENDGWKGYHSENSIITTLFGLLFWDVLFDDSVPGVFCSPFQVFSYS
jgi:fanconi-associated nuclease 1